MLSFGCVVIGFDHRQVRDATAEANALRYINYGQYTDIFWIEQRALAGWAFLPNQHGTRDAGVPAEHTI